jgi:hypothetical protein
VNVNESQLRNWLRQTDEALALEQSPAPDAESCRRLLARRTRTHNAVAISALLLAFCGVSAIYTMYRDARPIAANSPRPTREEDTNATTRRPENQQIAALPQEADGYAEKAAECQRVVVLLREAERLAALEEELAELEASRLNPLPATVRVQEEINRLATTQLVVAGRLLNEYDDAELAADVYRLVVAEFPETRWAATAQEVLSRLERRL